MEKEQFPNKPYSNNDISTSNPNFSFYSTLCAVAAAVISIICAFLFANLIYINQKRDDLSIGIIKNLQVLNMIIDEFSHIERTPSHPFIEEPYQRYASIMQKETWDESPLGRFDSYVDNIQKEIYDTRKAFRLDITEGAAFYGVKAILSNMCEQIYLEFPSPPGKIRREGDKKYYDAFIDDDFPNVKNRFLGWASKYNKYYEEINKLFSYDLAFAVWEIKRVAKFDVERIQKILKTKNTKIKQRLHMSDIETAIKRDSQYYDEIIVLMTRIKNQSSLIQREIKYYDDFTGKKPTVFIWILLAISLGFGVFIPLWLLSSVRKPIFISNNMWCVEMVAFAGFFVPLVTSFILLIKIYS